MKHQLTERSKGLWNICSYSEYFEKICPGQKVFNDPTNRYLIGFYYTNYYGQKNHITYHYNE